jgi:hypothetical protein
METATPLPQFSELNRLACSGFCRFCDREHSLPVAEAYQACLQLMDKLAAAERIDFQAAAEQADPRCTTSYLSGAARGKMFGVMVARTRQNRLVELRAFSGQYNGIWTIPGWVEPVFDLHEFHQVHDAEEKKIKELSNRINTTEKNDLQRPELIRQRKKKSQQLMQDIHGLYRLRNFSGQTAGLKEIFPEKTGIPTGTGDCCAPKLLQYAAAHDLVPLAMAEFYWGRSNRSGSRQHGCFYPSCRTKCYPILGFMLCGLPGNSKNG